MKKTYIYLLCCLSVFVSLVIYNYFQAQIALVETKETVLSISMINSSLISQVNTPTYFEWKIVAPEEFKASPTVVYYDYISSPSALSKLDSPESVGYQFKSQDYQKGTYFLPDTFSTNISFPNPGRVWYRGYALVRGNHLWTEEKYLDIKQ